MKNVETPDSVTIRLRDGRNQIVNLPSEFTLDKSSMYNDKVRGYDTLSERLQQMEHTINGPIDSGVRLAQVARLTLKSTEKQILADFGSGFLKSFERAYQDYSK